MTHRVGVDPVKPIHLGTVTIAARFACATLEFALIVMAMVKMVTMILQACAHSLQQPKVLPKANSINRDLEMLATVRTTPCREAEPDPAIDRQTAGAARYAWHDHLQTHQWQATPVSAQQPCVISPARHWSVTRYARRC